MIQEMAADNIVNPAFLTFIETSASKYIEHSKINDKVSHVNALNVYRDLFTKKKKSNVND